MVHLMFVGAYTSAYYDRDNETLISVRRNILNANANSILQFYSLGRLLSY